MAKKKNNTEIKRLFLSIKSIGYCNDKGKSVSSIGYKGKVIAKPDKPFGVIAHLLAEMLPMMDYSTTEAAAADLKMFKDYIDSLELKD